MTTQHFNEQVQAEVNRLVALGREQYQAEQRQAYEQPLDRTESNAQWCDSIFSDVANAQFEHAAFSEDSLSAREMSYDTWGINGGDYER